jgi:hypothetical protein
VDGSAHLVLAPSCQAYLLDWGGQPLWGPSNAPADPLRHPPPCTLELAAGGGLRMLDGNANVLWDSGAAAGEEAGPFTLTNADGALTETDAASNVLWRVPGAPAWSAQAPGQGEDFELPGGRRAARRCGLVAADPAAHEAPAPSAAAAPA